jgi:hypothetical protein
MLVNLSILDRWALRLQCSITNFNLWFLLRFSKSLLSRCRLKFIALLILSLGTVSRLGWSLTLADRSEMLGSGASILHHHKAGVPLLH